MDEKLEFSQRLKKAIEEAGYSIRPVVVEREFNTRYYGRSVTVQAVRRWLRGEAIPSQEKLQVLSDWLKIEPHYLRFGGSAKKIEQKRAEWNNLINYEEREAFEAYAALPSKERKMVKEIILAFAKACK